MTVVIERRADLTLENFRRVAVDGEGVVIGDAARAGDARRPGGLRRPAREGPDGLHVRRDQPARRRGEDAGGAGGSGGLGDGGHDARHGPRLRGGELDERVVRGIVFARLADFVEGNAKARPLVADRVAALLDGPLPKVPLNGQVAAAERSSR